ncbi:hypothetical protein LTR37_020300 [Vermiconidia calcicola]|uniref:Uncharacterized protein n=1 Tax=Vermiconidia calcicola TaxID=1690605 RepID=A0ACC3MBU0_9PEZI|nr:hypothetical protein LTR37_020300 [Vermiconidia calcicola]
MAAFLSSATSPGYEKAYVLLIHWSDDVEAMANAAHLKQVFKDVYGYKVRTVDEHTLDVKREMTKEMMSSKAVDWFLDYLGRLDDLEDDVDKEILLVLCYLGHGNAGEDHLFAISDEEATMQFSLTRLQDEARNASNADVLCIFECCQASHNGLSDEPLPADFKVTKKMETLGSGMGPTCLEACELDFTRRLAKNLIDDVGPTSVWSRSQAIAQRIEEEKSRNHAEVDDRDEVGNGSILLYPVVQDRVEGDEDDED